MSAIQTNGAIDMYDKSLVANLLPSEMIIKNYIHGNPDCNYEKYLLDALCNTGHTR